MRFAGWLAKAKRIKNGFAGAATASTQKSDAAVITSPQTPPACEKTAPVERKVKPQQFQEEISHRGATILITGHGEKAWKAAQRLVALVQEQWSEEFDDKIDRHLAEVQEKWPVPEEEAGELPSSKVVPPFKMEEIFKKGAKLLITVSVFSDDSSGEKPEHTKFDGTLARGHAFGSLKTYDIAHRELMTLVSGVIREVKKEKETDFLKGISVGCHFVAGPAPVANQVAKSTAIVEPPPPSEVEAPSVAAE